MEFRPADRPMPGQHRAKVAQIVWPNVGLADLPHAPAPREQARIVSAESVEGKSEVLHGVGSFPKSKAVKSPGVLVEEFTFDFFAGGQLAHGLDGGPTDAVVSLAEFVRTVAAKDQLVLMPSQKGAREL